MSCDDSDGSCSFDSSEFWVEPLEHLKALYDEIYKQADDYTREHLETPEYVPLANSSTLPPITSNAEACPTEQATTSNPQPVTPVTKPSFIDYNSKEWIDCQLFIDSGGKFHC